MAKHRPDISNAIKEKLVVEAGNKCANPGCPTLRTHIHHIRQWHVYQSHDARHMIAVCPTCHDAIHHGALPIDDETLHRWKALTRSATSVRDYLYVEPNSTIKLLLGTIAVAAPRNAVVFELSAQNRLAFRIEDSDILLLNLALCSLSGKEILRVIDNHIEVAAQDAVVYERVPGHVRVTVPASEEYIQWWAVSKMRRHKPDFGSNGKVMALDLEVMRPGLVRVEGVWVAPGRAIIVTKEEFAFIRPNMRQPLALVGAGEDSVLLFVSEKIDARLFGL